MYPKLSSIINEESLPQELSFIEIETGDIFEQLYFSDFRKMQSTSGDSISFQQKLISYKKLKVEIPGTGLVFVLNAAHNNTSEIPVDISFYLGILKYIKNINITALSTHPRDIFNLVLKITDISVKDLLATCISFFIDDTDPITAFVVNTNTNYSLNIPLPVNPDSQTALIEIIDYIDNSPVTIYEIIFMDYLLDLNSIDSTLGNIDKLFLLHTSKRITTYIRDLFIPKIYASFKLTGSIEFPRSILIPLDTNGEPLPITDPSNPPKAILQFAEGEFRYSTNGVIGFKSEIAATLIPTYSQIGKTGIVISFTNVKVDFSRTRNIPEATADGRPDDFVGVFIEEASIGLPPKWFKQQSGTTLEIYGEKIIAGTGGFSGKIGLKVAGSSNPPLPPTDPNHEFSIKLGGSDSDPNKGFSIGFKQFDLVFERNSIIESNIAGTLTLPSKFSQQNSSDPVLIDIKAHFNNNGDFNITGSSAGGFYAYIKDVLEIQITELEVGKVDDNVYLETKGSIRIIHDDVSQKIPDTIQIKKLVIWDDGKIEFKGGGTIILPEPKSLKIGPVELTVTALHIGTHEQMHGTFPRQYMYIGFDGGVSINPGGVDARGDGIKFYFTIDNDPQQGLNFHFFIRIESIYIDLIIPGNASPAAAAVLLSGYLSMKGTDGGIGQTTVEAGPEYCGAVSISLPKVNIAGSATILMNPKFPSFLVDLSLQLPVPITLGPTGLGIYGFRGLLGQRYVASKECIQANDWWEYYKKKVHDKYAEGIYSGKFYKTQGFSLGAGISLDTVVPLGKKKAFTSKVFFNISMPTVLLIQGQAAFIKESLGLVNTSDPPFSALVAIDDQSVTANLGVNIKVPDDTGMILVADALAEMGFFYHNPDAWYINVGTKAHPVNGRIFKDIFNINAHAYLMISAAGIDTGAGISFYKKAEAGPLSAELSAYIDVYGKISFKPVQIGAGMSLGGLVDLRIWRFGLRLSAAASLGAEVPHPFVISGDVSACIRVLKKDRCIKFSFNWILDKNPNDEEIQIQLPIPGVTISNGMLPGSMAQNVMSLDTYPICVEVLDNNDNLPLTFSHFPVIPVDSKINIEFLKAVNTNPGTNFKYGAINSSQDNYTTKIPLKKGILQQVTHAFSIESINIYYRDFSNDSWKLYDVYEAIKPVDTSIVTYPVIGNYGEWQLTAPGKVNRLSVLARTPFDWLRNMSEPPPLGSFNIPTESAVFCPPEVFDPACFDYEDYPDTTVQEGDSILYEGVWFRINGADASIGNVVNTFNLNKALIIEPQSYAEFFFPEPVAWLKLRLSSKTSTISVEYYKRADTGVFDINSLPVYSYVLIRAETLLYSNLISPVIYEDAQNPVDMVIVRAGDECDVNCDDLIDALETSSRDTVDLLQSQQIVISSNIQHHELHAENSPDNLFAQQNSFLAAQKEEAQLQITEQINTLNSFSEQVTCFLLQEDGDNILLEGSATDGILLETGSCVQPIPCGSYIFSICWQPISEYTASEFEQWSNVVESTQAMLDALNKTVEPIWRPSGTYVIQIRTLENLSDGVSKTYRRTFNYGFRTEGPLGHFHNYDSKYTIANADEYKLAKLKHYIDIDKSYPNADGNLLNAKPLYYRSPKIQLFFKYPYVYTMYTDLAPYPGMHDVQSNLQIILKDPQDPEIIPYATPVWSVSEIETTGIDIEVLNNMIVNGNNCVQATPVDLLNVSLNVNLFNIKPLKLYTAIFNAKYSGHLDGSNVTDATNEVHRFVFQTSRYGCFKEQVLSYLSYEINDTTSGFDVCSNCDLSLVTIHSEAFFDLNVIKASNVAGAIPVFNDTLLNPSDPDPDNLVSTYSHIFNRLFEGALKLQALNAPESTEFNMMCVVDDTTGDTTGQVAGILIRNPEPFNDPKIPADEIIQTICVVDSNGNVNPAYKTVYSKDLSQAFISNQGLNITDEQLLIRFRYLVFNGQVYELEANSEVVVALDVRAPMTRLTDTDCGRTEVGLREELSAIPVIGAFGYEFKIETDSGDPVSTYTCNDENAKLPLLQVSSLNYNSVYKISVRPLISGRNTSYGQECQISTKNLTIYIVPPSISFQGIPVQIRIEVRDSSGTIINNYFGSVTLNATGSCFGAGLVDIENGIGYIVINDNVAEIVYLSLEDTEQTGLNLGPDQTIEFIEVVATTLKMECVPEGVQGIPVTVTVKAIDNFGHLDIDFNGTVTLNVSGNAVVPNGGIINIANGIGTIEVNNDVAETIQISMSDTGGTNLILTPPSLYVEFKLQSATKLVINDPVDGYFGFENNITVVAKNDFNVQDTNFQGKVTVIGSGSSPFTIQNDGLADIINGHGAVTILSNTAQIIELSLSDTNGTGLDVSSVQNIEFLDIVASYIEMLDPDDSIQGTPSIVTIRALNPAGLLDVSFNCTVTLIATGSAIVPNGGVISIVDGIGTIEVNNNAAETVQLSLTDSGGTGLDLSLAIQDLIFDYQPATKFVIVEPQDALEKTEVIITVLAINDFDVQVPVYNGSVTLEAIGTYPVTIQNGGLVNIIGGAGTVAIYSDYPQILTLTLVDSDNTGLNVESTQQLVYVIFDGIAFKDNFTDTYGTTLEQHTPDIGDSWTKLIQVASGTLKINTNKYTLVPGTGGIGKGVLYTCDVGNEYNNADYLVEIKQIEGGTSQRYNYLAARIIDENNMYVVRFNKNASELYLRSNGNWQLLAAGGGTSNGSVVKFEVMGNKLRFYEGFESNIIYVTDNTISDAGKAGFGMGLIIGSDGTMNTQEFDALIVRWGGDISRVFLDKFSTNGQLGSYIPETGLGWIQRINVGSSLGIQVNNGVAVKTDNGKKVGRGSFYTATVDGGMSSGNYEAELMIVNGDNPDNSVTMGVRVQNQGNDGYFVRFLNSESRLYKRIGGIWIALGQANVDGVPNGSTVRLRIVDNLLQFEVDGYVVLEETVTEITTPGEAGFGFGALMDLGDAEKNQKIDNFVVRYVD
jgi:hypothetical protein